MRLTFDFESKIPIYRQIRDQIVIGIADGRLKQGDRLPTIRELADESGINMLTVSKAYRILNNEGYTVTDRRKGTLISYEGSKKTPDGETLKKLKLIISELQLTSLTKEEVLSLCKKYYEEEF